MMIIAFPEPLKTNVEYHKYVISNKKLAKSHYTARHLFALNE